MKNLIKSTSPFSFIQSSKAFFQVAKRIFDPFYENLDFGDWALQNGADDPELAAIIEDYFP